MDTAATKFTPLVDLFEQSVDLVSPLNHSGCRRRSQNIEIPGQMILNSALLGPNISLNPNE